MSKPTCYSAVRVGAFDLSLPDPAVLFRVRAEAPAGMSHRPGSDALVVPLIVPPPLLSAALGIPFELAEFHSHALPHPSVPSLPASFADVLAGLPCRAGPVQHLRSPPPLCTPRPCRSPGGHALSSWPSTMRAITLSSSRGSRPTMQGGTRNSWRCTTSARTVRCGGL